MAIFGFILMFQQVREEPARLQRMMQQGLRVMTSPIDHHVKPYGTVELSQANRLLANINASH